MSYVTGVEPVVGAVSSARSTLSALARVAAQLSDSMAADQAVVALAGVMLDEGGDDDQGWSARRADAADRLADARIAWSRAGQQAAPSLALATRVVRGAALQVVPRDGSATLASDGKPSFLTAWVGGAWAFGGTRAGDPAASVRALVELVLAAAFPRLSPEDQAQVIEQYPGAYAAWLRQQSEDTGVPLGPEYAVAATAAWMHDNGRESLTYGELAELAGGDDEIARSASILLGDPCLLGNIVTVQGWRPTDLGAVYHADGVTRLLLQNHISRQLADPEVFAIFAEASSSDDTITLAGVEAIASGGGTYAWVAQRLLSYPPGVSDPPSFDDPVAGGQMFVSFDSGTFVNDDPLVYVSMPAVYGLTC